MSYEGDMVAACSNHQLALPLVARGSCRHARHPSPPLLLLLLLLPLVELLHGLYASDLHLNLFDVILPRRVALLPLQTRSDHVKQNPQPEEDTAYRQGQQEVASGGPVAVLTGKQADAGHGCDPINLSKPLCESLNYSRSMITHILCLGGA